VKGWSVKPAHVVALLVVTVCVSGCIEQAPPAVERGHIISALPADQLGENTGAGAVAGVVLGATIGAVVGGQGAGRIIGAVAGELVGGATGAAVEGASQTATGIAYTIKLLDGRVVTVVEHQPAGEPTYANGSQVGIETRGRAQHVVTAVWIE